MLQHLLLPPSKGHAARPICDGGDRNDTAHIANSDTFPCPIHSPLTLLLVTSNNDPPGSGTRPCKPWLGLHSLSGGASCSPPLGEIRLPRPLDGCLPRPREGGLPCTMKRLSKYWIGANRSQHQRRVRARARCRPAAFNLVHNLNVPPQSASTGRYLITRMLP